MICTNCGFSGPGKRSMKGSFIIELGLWLFLIIPGLIYSIWRQGTKAYNVCPKCSYPNMIPSDTPIGKKLISEYGIEVEDIQDVVNSPSVLWKVGGAFVLLIFIYLFFAII